ncbi:putative Dcp1-like decapping family protein [Elsinoe australis]|uniref:Putative Dcp1-like decapping family protein n=1 Tax=Elsinoe australis TaxID=40998 RepID=A0A4U7B4Y7_9PEZI|nr:putative Dcp1-like decapping family protein [Elsinoe australis]
MPPKKHRRPRQPAPVEASDYDSEAFTTDAAQLAQKAAPHAPARTNEELNLTVLKRHNASVQQILSVAGFACVYRFSPESQTWVKIGVEGALFVSELLPVALPNAYPGGPGGGEGSGLVERYGVAVLNRKGLNNFNVELRSAGDVDVDEEYVILQVGEGEEVEEGIYGLWIFCPQGNTTDREVAAAVITECAGRAERSRAAAEEVLGEVGNGEYEQGYEDGYEDGQQGNGYANGHEGYEQGRQDQMGQQYPAQSNQQGGQQIDLLSLFGKPAGQPQHQQSQHQQPQYQQDGQYYQGGYQQAQQAGPQSGGYPHSHPQPPSQASQAQNLLSLFKR